MCNRQTEMVTYTLLPQKIYRMMSHSRQARLWIMVLAVCSVTPLIHAARDILHCHNLEYFLFFFILFFFFFINRDLYYHYITYNTFTTKFKVTKNYN